jgi:peptidoglycan-associated lipoprotein
MFKKLSSLALIFLISSCISSKQPLDLTTKSVNDQQKGRYETINSEQEATKMNEEVSTEIGEEVEVEDRVFFNLNSSELTDAAKMILDGQSEWLKSDSSINILIEGHCDERGTREYNIALGEKRANASRDYLVSQNINVNRIKVVSYGKEKPSLIGHGESVWSKNRAAITVPTK